MSYDKDLVEAVIKHADIVKITSAYLNVSKKGKDYLAICPFHDDTNPSMHISPSKQIFKCFVCGTSGNAIGFVQKYEHISFMEALKKVAELSNYDDPRLSKAVHVKPVDAKKAPLYACTRDLTLFYQYALNTAEGKEGLDYFENRHLDAEMRKKYQLGYSFKDGKVTCKYLQEKGHSLKTIEDIGITTIVGSKEPTDRNAGRVIFPICDANGEIVGYSARRIKDGPEAKYVNSPETPLFHKSNILYNYHIAKEKARIAGYIYVLEGFMDVFALSRIGIDSAVALMGTALTNEHIAMLRSLNVEIRLCLDGDLPGQSNTMVAAKALDNAGLKFRIVDNQGSSKDPDEILNEEGEDKLRYYLTNLINRVDFALNYYQRSNPLKTIDEKKKLIREFIPILIDIRSQLELDSYLRRLSNITGFEMESIRDIVMKGKESGVGQTPEQMMSQFHPERKLLKRLEIAEREILYQMVNDKTAIAFYEEEVGSFYDEIYRQLASYIVEYYAENGDTIDALGLINNIQMGDAPNKDSLVNELTTLLMEKNHPSKCTPELLNNLLESINKEKVEIFEKDALEQSLEGKSELEKARILAQYNREKLKRESDDNSKSNKNPK